MAVRTVQRWGAGARAVPSSLAGELRELLVERRVEIDELLTALTDADLT